jgi:hypothetical protein
MNKHIKDVIADLTFYKDIRQNNFEQQHLLFQRLLISAAELEIRYIGALTILEDMLEALSMLSRKLPEEHLQAYAISVQAAEFSHPSSNEEI